MLNALTFVIDFSLCTACLTTPPQRLYPWSTTRSEGMKTICHLPSRVSPMDISTRSDTAFPSWVPDWRRSRVRNLPAWPSQPGNYPSDEYFSISMRHTRLVDGALKFQECDFTRHIAHVFVPLDAESWSWDELKHWAWPRKEFGADEKTLWSTVQKAAFEALCLGISLLLDAKEVSDDQSQHLRLALQFFDGNQTLSIESTALHVPSLMPLMRWLLSHYALISCSAQDGDTLEFGIGPSATSVGDRILYRSSFSWACRGNIGCVIRPCQDQSFSTRDYQVVDAKSSELLSVLKLYRDK